MQKIYHISSRYMTQEYFTDNLNLIWEKLTTTIKNNACKLHVAVLMSNHYHALLQTDSENIDSIVTSINHKIFKNDNLAIKVVDVTNFKQYIYTAQYILENPVRAGLVDDAQKYKYSTINEQTFMDPMALNLHWLLYGCSTTPMNSVHSIVYGIDDFFS